MNKKNAALAVVMTLGLTVTGAGVGAANATANPTQKFLVTFTTDSSLPSNYADLITAAGGKILKALPELGAVEAESSSSTFLSTIQASALVQDAGAENITYLDDVTDDGAKAPLIEAQGAGIAGASHDLYDQFQWDIKQVTNNGASWNLANGTGKSANGKDIVVALVDTGIDYNHPDLKKNYLYGKSFVPGEPDPIDESGHGTHVAGAIAANGRVMGVGPDLKLASYRVFGAYGGAETSDIALAIRTAADDNVDVINMSLGGFDWFQDPSSTTKAQVADKKILDRAIAYAISKGVTVVNSAGNNGIDLHSPGQISKQMYVHGATKREPGEKDMIRVSATGEELNLAYYSNYGKNMIDVAAPGGDFGTAWMQDYDYTLMDYSKRCLSTTPGGGYQYMMGTSMAAPKAAAVAGLIIAKHGKDVLTPAQVKDIMQSSATDINAPGFDDETGYGLVNAVNALKK